MTAPLRCVVDTSVGVKQFIPDPLSTKVVELFAHLDLTETKIFVPDLFYIESANVLWKYVRAGRYDFTLARANLASLKEFTLSVVPTAELMEQSVNIALAHGISVYDASYVALSQQVLAPLLTLDRKLANALANAPFDVRLFTDFSISPLP